MIKTARKFKNDDLENSYRKDADFRKQIKKAEENYQFLRFKSAENNQEKHDEISFIEKIVIQTNESVYFLYGFMQPHPKNQRTKLTLQFFYHFRPEPNQKFTFVYFNHKTASSDYFVEFKNLFLMVPLTIMQNMKTFYLVKPTFYIKAVSFMDFGIINNFFSSRYYTLQKCEQLCSIINLSIQDFVSFVPQVISKQFPQKYRSRMSLRNFRVNFYGQNISQSTIKQKSEFEQMVKGLIKKEVYKIEDYEVGELGVPIILQVLVSYFKNNPQSLHLEGLFRKSISIDEQDEVFEQLARHNYEYVEKITNPHLIATLLKKFFFNLKEPIIQFQQFKELMSQKCKVNKEELKGVIETLPKLNFITMMYLLDFLRKFVIKNEQFNKMTANNIAICFSPCFMRSQVFSNADFAYSTKTIFFINLMIKEYDFIFGSQAQRNSIFQQKIARHSKQFEQTIKKQLHYDDQEQELPYNNNKGHIQQKWHITIQQQIDVKSILMKEINQKYENVQNQQIVNKQQQKGDLQGSRPKSQDVKQIIQKQVKKMQQSQQHQQQFEQPSLVYSHSDSTSMYLRHSYDNKPQTHFNQERVTLVLSPNEDDDDEFEKQMDKLTKGL